MKGHVALAVARRVTFWRSRQVSAVGPRHVCHLPPRFGGFAKRRKEFKMTVSAFRLAVRDFLAFCRASNQPDAAMEQVADELYDALGAAIDAGAMAADAAIPELPPPGVA